MSDTIAIFGSGRRDGNTGKLINTIADILDIDIIDLAKKDISPFDYEHKNIHDDFHSTMDKVLEYDKIIFVSPVYWFSMSAQMKIFIDRMSDFLSVDHLKAKGRQLRGKTAYVVCTSISLEVDPSFIKSFKDTFEYLGMKYGGYIHANCENGYIEDHYTKDIDTFINLVKLN